MSFPFFRDCESIGTVRGVLLQITDFIQIFRFNTIVVLCFVMCRARWGGPHGSNLSFHCPETIEQC
jgi:hypothetical protein